MFGNVNKIRAVQLAACIFAEFFLVDEQQEIKDVSTTQIQIASMNSWSKESEVGFFAHCIYQSTDTFIEPVNWSPNS